jgi:class 3 adenylate cyclase
MRRPKVDQPVPSVNRVGSGAPTPLRALTETLINEVLLEERLEALEAAQAWRPRVVSKLETLLRSGDDFDLFRINPIRFAAERAVDEAEAIDLFLQANKVGLLDMDWMLVCASCANVYTSFRKLERLDPHFVCDMCSMQNDAELDEHVQVAFTVSPKLRRIVFHEPAALGPEDLIFRFHFSNDIKAFPNGTSWPALLRRWTKLQVHLEPNESIEVETELTPGFLAIRDVVNAGNAMYVVTDDQVEKTILKLVVKRGSIIDRDRDLIPQTVTLPPGNPAYATQSAEATEIPPAVADRTSPFEREQVPFTFNFPAMAQLHAGHVTFRIDNEGKSRASVWVVGYPPVEELYPIEFEPALTAKRLLSTQTFRRLFRSETVPRSEGLKVRDLTYLFSDLKGSTAIYDVIGDVNAYNLVRLHFEVLVKAVSQNAGAVVKTIGDAIMATFISPAHGVRAAIDMISELSEFNKGASAALILKIGIHRGRSIAVTLNDRIDYFGQSVNIAARIQQLADAGEIVVSEDVYQHPGVSDLLGQFPVRKERGLMKGVEDEIPVYRVKPASQLG